MKFYVLIALAGMVLLLAGIAARLLKSLVVVLAGIALVVAAFAYLNSIITLPA